MCRAVHQVLNAFPHKGGQAREQGVEAPVLSEMRYNDGPDRPAGQHWPPGSNQRGLQQSGGEVIVYVLCSLQNTEW